VEPSSLSLPGGQTAAFTTEEYGCPLNVFLCISSRAALRTIQVSRTYFSRHEAPETPSNAEFNARNYRSTLRYVFMSWRLIKHRNKFIFTYSCKEYTIVSVHLNDIALISNSSYGQRRQGNCQEQRLFFVLTGSPLPYSDLLLIRFKDHFTNFIFILLV
jgi:hypothetical protein